jgi:hypothetical protein
LSEFNLGSEVIELLPNPGESPELCAALTKEGSVIIYDYMTAKLHRRIDSKSADITTGKLVVFSKELYS